MVKTEEEMGRVWVEGGRYKIKGKFHIPEANSPIFNKETNKLVGVTNPRDMTYIHSYGGEAIFFESLGKGKFNNGAVIPETESSQRHKSTSIIYHRRTKKYRKTIFNIN